MDASNAEDKCLRRVDDDVGGVQEVWRTQGLCVQPADVEGCLAAQSLCDDRSKFVRRQQMTQPTPELLVSLIGATRI